MFNIEFDNRIWNYFGCSKEENRSKSNTSIIWNGPIKTFQKKDGSDPNNEINQDRLTKNVWITRKNDGGQILNIAKETSYDKYKSPLGSEWAIGTLDQIDSLSFNTFRSISKPQFSIGKKFVVHLIEDDIYLSIEFKSWSSGKKGGF